MAHFMYYLTKTFTQTLVTMKRTLHILIATLIPGFLSAQTVLIFEDFESYANGQLLAQTAGLPWSTWSNAPGSAEDTPISNEQASSGALSAKFTGAAAGGPTDIVLRLGDRTAGIYSLSWNMYVAQGNGGYFNLQHNEVIGAGSWMMEMIFLPNGTINYVSGGSTVTGSYVPGTWFMVNILVDLNAQTAGMAIDGMVQHTWQTNVPGPNQLGAVNIFAYAGGAGAVPLFYIDDVTFLDITTVGIEEADLTHVGIYPNPVNDVLTVELAGHTPTAIASLVDLTGRVVIDGRTFMQNGPVARTQLNMAGLPSGLYLVRVQDGMHEVVRRVTKM